MYLVDKTCGSVSVNPGGKYSTYCVLQGYLNKCQHSNTMGYHTSADLISNLNPNHLKYYHRHFWKLLLLISTLYTKFHKQVMWRQWRGIPMNLSSKLNWNDKQTCIMTFWQKFSPLLPLSRWFVLSSGVAKIIKPRELYDSIIKTKISSSQQILKCDFSESINILSAVWRRCTTCQANKTGPINNYWEKILLFKIKRN
jgi:hypothetical protein